MKTKILMFLTDYMSYKTFLDLKNFIYNKNDSNIELEYQYFNYTCTYLYKSQILPYLFYPTNEISSNIEKTISSKHGGFVIQYTMFMESFMFMLINFLKNKEDLLNITASNWLFPNIGEWLGKFNKSNEKTILLQNLNKIPKADIYLISSRHGFKNFITLTIETALALYLIRKYNSKVFIGGGSINEYDNPIIKLINAVGKEYTNGQLEYVIGTIGINVYNYIKGYEYQNKRTPIERNVLPLNIAKNEMIDYFNNNFTMELVRGCTQRCPYCCNSYINMYDKVDINIYDNWFNYLSNNFPSTHLYFYAPEINSDSKYFDNILDYLINNNIQNPLSFYLNIIKITDEQIDKLTKLNIRTLNFALDLLFDNVSYKQYDSDKISKKIDKILQLQKNNTIIYAYIVANVPKYAQIEYIKYKEIFNKYKDIIQYSEFVLFISTNIAKYPQKYGMSFEYYKNLHKELLSIENIINQVPIMYFREDTNREQIINTKYNILNNMRQDVMKGVIFGFNNEFFLQLLIEQILPDINIIKNRNIILDKLIYKYQKENNNILT